MLSQNQIGFLRSLGSKKHRQKYHKYLAEGEKLVREALRDCPQLVTDVVAQFDLYEVSAFHIPNAVRWVEASGKDIDRISSLTTPPGILAVIAMPDPLTLPQLRLFKRHLYLDGISDPGNLGGILRTADWFGVRSVILGTGTVEWTNPKVVQASMGSVFRLSIKMAGLEEVLEQLPGISVMAADMAGDQIETFQWPAEGVLALGSESHGLSKEVVHRIHQHLTISPAPDCVADSLNVGVAAGILLHAWQQSLDGH